jgi:hypothetical protein
MSDKTNTAPARSVWKTIAVFAVVGPFVGSSIGVLTLLQFSGKIMSLADLGSASFVTYIFGYMFGLLPAALTGFAVAASSKRQSHLSTVRLGAVWGAVLASLAGLQVAWLGGGGARVLTVCFFAIMGAIAGSVCGWVVRANQR